MRTLNQQRMRIVGRLHRIFDHRFDRKYGVETTENVGAGALVGEVDLSGYDKDVEIYAGSPSMLFKALHAPLARMNRQRTTYVDIGCGKGRMLMQASQAGFEKTVGVEFAASLGDIARENLTAALGSKGGHWRVDHGDARTYRYPDGDIALFLYNPFDPPVFKAFLENLLADLAERPRALGIIYNNAFCADLLDREPAFVRLPYKGLGGAFLRLMNPHDCGAWRYVVPSEAL